jgi:hypothetical protein
VYGECERVLANQNPEWCGRYGNPNEQPPNDNMALFIIVIGVVLLIIIILEALDYLI